MKAKKNREKIFRSYVAFLDILGFSALIRRQNGLESFTSFFDIIKKASTNEDRNIDYLMFSDSIILSAKEYGEEHLIKILSAVAEISFELLVELNAPIRGCVSFGDFSRIEDADGNTIIAGTPIIDAYHYEKKQNWVGVMLSPEIVRHHRDLKELAPKKFPLNMLIRHIGNIPFHNENPQDDIWFEGFTVVPHGLESLSDESQARDCIRKDQTEYRDKLIELKICSPDIKAQKKYQHSIDWLRAIRQSF